MTDRFEYDTARVYDPSRKLSDFSSDFCETAYFDLSFGGYTFKGLQPKTIQYALLAVADGSAIEFVKRVHKNPYNDSYPLPRDGDFFMGAKLEKYQVLYQTTGEVVIGEYLEQDVPHIPLSSSNPPCFLMLRSLTSPSPDSIPVVVRALSSKNRDKGTSFTLDSRGFCTDFHKGRFVNK